MIGLKYKLRVNNADRSEDTGFEPVPGYRHDRDLSARRVSYLIVKTPPVHFRAIVDTTIMSLKPRRNFWINFLFFFVTEP